MKRIFKLLGYFFLFLLVVIASVVIYYQIKWSGLESRSQALMGEIAPRLESSGHT